ncbi:MAG: SNF2-related protein [Saprospiraceae bacterium]
MRKTYGNTWWGKQWLKSLDNIDFSNRLPRGKTYANKGLAQEIEIDNNIITAEVQGSVYKPYQVKFTIPEFTKNEKSVILSLISENPFFLSKLLNRELPPNLNRLCQIQNINIFPERWDDLQGSCSCPDHAVPCKHMAAVLYLIANEIDKNPFVVFQLHDFDLFQELEKEGFTAGEKTDVSIFSIDYLQQPFSLEKNKKEWNEEIFNKLDFSILPDCRERLLTIMREQPVFYNQGDFKIVLEKVYAKISKEFSKKNKNELEKTITPELDAIEEVEIILDDEINFVTINLRDAKEQSVLVFDEEKELVNWLEKIPSTKITQLSHPIRGLFLSFLFAKKLIEKSAYHPQILEVKKEQFKIRWVAATLNDEVKNIFEKVALLTPNDLIFYKKGDDILEPIPEDNFMTLVSFFLNHFVKTSHGLDYKYLVHPVANLFFNGSVERFIDFENKEFPKAIQLWLNKFYISKKDFAPVIIIDDQQEEGIFEVKVAVEDQSKPLDAPIQLERILKEKKFSSIRLEVLRNLAMLGDYFPQINFLLASKGKEQLFFDSDEFVDILFKIIPTIRLFGIKILLPKGLRKLMRPKLSIKINLEKEESESGDTGGKSVLNLGAMLNFDWKIALGNKLVSQDDFSKMVDQFSGIVKINEEYVFFDENEIQILLDKLKNPPDLKPNVLFQTALKEEYQGAKIAFDKKAKELMKSLLDGKEADIPKGLQATLRPYQLSGYEWMYKNYRLGLGSVIADDMGLGKTLQVITILLKLKEDGQLQKQKALVIVPTTLLTNWENEIRKFAPNLKAYIYHGANRKIEPLQEADVLLTTYGVARTETARLQKQKWGLLAIDEAQNIKNPSTAQTKAIKKIKATVRIAMSGTPVENRLSEYWSIFDFTNKGYLGSLSNFKKDYAKPIEIDRDQTQLDIFKKITEPFIMRRLKSDKSVIKDLPEKIEIDQFCKLTPQQTAIYQNVLDTTMQAVEVAEGVARKGIVLKLITALKQVCNHPKQFLKKGNADPALSGKTQLLFDLMKQILEQGEKTLIFTQYQEMGKMLVEMLEKEFGLEIAFLHGGVSRKKRDEMVEDFQNNRTTRVLILSLKAGGTGLNLTAANNVIHYDLWWNPAVEAQATDRAYRIGQKKNVMVHRFITQGTFEEKINQLLISKKELAELTVSTGEKWIGEYSNDELKELVSLG